MSIPYAAQQPVPPKTVEPAAPTLIIKSPCWVSIFKARARFGLSLMLRRLRCP